MSAAAPSSSPDPRSSRVVVPSVAVVMPCPTPAPPAAATAADEKRPAPLMKKVKLLLAKAVSSVFGRMNRKYGVALVGLQTVMVVIRVVTFTTDPEVARFWLPFLRALLYLGLACIVFMACWNCMCYCIKYYLQQQTEAAAELQLPPPPPEMDIC